MRDLRTGLAFITALALAGPAMGWAGEVSLASGGIRATKTVRSFQEIRQARVIRQRWDLSCGSAALSTILTYHHGVATSESDIIVFILRRTDPVRVKARGGFSLLDLKRFVEARGFEGKGYAGLSLKDLTGLGAPAIVSVNLNGYDHFVVFRGILGDRVILADPAYGNMTMKAERFVGIWKNGIAFVVLRRDSSSSPEGLAVKAEEFLVPDGTAIMRAVRGDGPNPLTRHGL